ncbi:hypothetical protein BDV26DRAFT_263171 [Aspergillus bertholletiae]|uniref:Uncharacterized protein n=1 Tax=Aspergillus bertholletiae TaxID=1226010 RepID=A0A5N7B6J1_9EURO|nr:hypothetical protein BDV26DRAFT_263171 [Aspergillus bertholletiae]
MCASTCGGHFVPTSGSSRRKDLGCCEDELSRVGSKWLSEWSVKMNQPKGLSEPTNTLAKKSRCAVEIVRIIHLVENSQHVRHLERALAVLSGQFQHVGRPVSNCSPGGKFPRPDTP